MYTISQYSFYNVYNELNKWINTMICFLFEKTFLLNIIKEFCRNLQEENPKTMIEVISSMLYKLQRVIWLSSSIKSNKNQGTKKYGCAANILILILHPLLPLNLIYSTPSLEKWTGFGKKSISSCKKNLLVKKPFNRKS